MLDHYSVAGVAFEPASGKRRRMVKEIRMEQDFLFAEPLQDGPGSTWTLAARLGQILMMAESRYGDRDKSYTILGVEIGGEIPMVWYPSGLRCVIVRLSRNCVDDCRQAVFQLAHECIHLLSPSGNSTATVLEEGLASKFSSECIGELGFAPMASNHLSYLEAEGLVRSLEWYNPAAVRQIRLREQKDLWRVAAENILAVVPNAPRDLAEALARPFVR